MSNGQVVDSFHVGIELGSDVAVKTSFRRSESKGFEVEETIYRFGKEIDVPNEPMLQIQATLVHHWTIN
jgi:hypothetical protein